MYKIRLFKMVRQECTKVPSSTSGCVEECLRRVRRRNPSTSPRNDAKRERKGRKVELLENN